MSLKGCLHALITSETNTWNGDSNGIGEVQSSILYDMNRFQDVYLLQSLKGIRLVYGAYNVKLCDGHSCTLMRCRASWGEPEREHADVPRRHACM